MAETIANAVEQKAATTPSAPKKNRRGITNETRATSYLKFHEKDATQQGLFIACVDSVECSWVSIKDDASKQGVGTFAGMSIPRLVVRFTSLHENPAQKRHVTLQLNPVESSVETYANGSKAWAVDNNLRYIKHLLDTFYLDKRELTDEEMNALALDYDDCDENNEYVPVEQEDVIASWGKIFKNAAAMLNGEFANNGAEASGKPCYKDNNGKPYRLFIKLLRHIKTGKGRDAKWKNVAPNGDLAFPGMVGEGVFERMKTSDAQPTILRLNPLTESITPKQVAEPQAPSMPNNIPPMPGMPGMVVDNGGGYNDAGYGSEAVSGMPF